MSLPISDIFLLPCHYLGQNIQAGEDAKPPVRRGQGGSAWGETLKTQNI